MNSYKTTDTTTQPTTTPPEPKTCLSCGAKQLPDGTLPCGH